MILLQASTYDVPTSGIYHIEKQAHTLAACKSEGGTAAVSVYLLL